MATLVSPGVSVSVIDESFYIPAAAPTVPLFFVATRAGKKQPDGVTDALGTLEHGVVRTITSLKSSVETYGVPYFRTDDDPGRTGVELHGDARNEYGLFALNQHLTVANVAYVVRVDVDLADADVIPLTVGTVGFIGTGTNTITGPVANPALVQAGLWALVATSSTVFSVTFTPTVGEPVVFPSATVNVPYVGPVSFTLTGTGYVLGDALTFSIDEGTPVPNPLGADDAARRASIVTALQAEINLNQDVRSELYEYNLLLCPGYPEVVDELLNLNLALNEETFVVADTPFGKTPEDTALWALAEPTPATPTVQQLTITADGGTYTLTLDGQTTAPITFSATAAAVQTALNGGLTVTGTSPLVFTWPVGSAAVLSINGTSLTGGTAVLTLVAQGAAAVPGRQRSANVAYYYPHALASNLDGHDVVVAASGVALKTIAYSDSVSEVWYPPAGPRRGLVTGVTDVGYVNGDLGTSTAAFVPTPLSQGQRDILYQFPANINPIPFFTGRGIMVFGQKTSAAAASAMDRENVVRMLIKIKREIRKAAFAYLFELNDRITRDSIKLMIDNYLNDIMLRRGLYDFVTQCNEINNTPTRIDRNELWIDIAIKPSKSIEFIYIPIRVISTGA